MRIISILMAFWLMLGAAAAQTTAIKPVVAEKPEVVLNRVEAALAKPRPDLRGLREDVETSALSTTKLVGELENNLKPLHAQIEALGEASPDEPTLLRRQRAELDRALADQEAQLRTARLLVEQLNTLSTRIASEQRKAFATELGARGPVPLAPESLARFWRDLAQAAPGPGVLNQWPFLLQYLALLAAFGVAAGLAIMASSRAIDGWQARHVPDGTRIQRFVHAMIAMTIRLIAPLLSVIMLGAMMSWGMTAPKDWPVFGSVTQSLPVIIFGQALLRAWFAPQQPRFRVGDYNNDVAGQAYRMSVVLVIIKGLDSGLQELTTNLGWSLASAALLSLIGVTVAAPMILRLVALMRPTAGHGGVARLVRLVVVLAALAAPVLALFGWHALSRFLLLGVFKSAVLLLVLALVFAAIAEIAALRSRDGRAPWWLPLILGTGLAVLSLPVFVVIWGVNAQDVSVGAQRLLTGVRVGGGVVRPADVMVMVLILIIGLALTRSLRHQLEHRVFPDSSLDLGTRSALISAISYIGTGLTLIMTLAASPFDLSNLAVIAGALSVGIGFGLQNVVSNFVSGLILLAERPVRVGDWVKVGAYEGTIRSMRVRSTEIETFDRARVIVPNNDLITAAVINLTRGDGKGVSPGRLILPVGVGYNSDPDQVIECLTEVAMAHPGVTSIPPPIVVLRRFGASALDFELRVVINDVNEGIKITSDLNLAILRRLREAAIDIPFPQQDVWVHQVPSPSAPSSPVKL